MRRLVISLVLLAGACGGGDDDGSGWVEVTDVPEQVSFRALWVFSEDRVWLGGSMGTIEAFDGSSWTSEPTPAPGAIMALWALGPDDVWACAGTSILHHDGAQWTVVADTEADGLRSTTGIWASGPQDVYVVGDDAIAVRWDGTATTRIPLPESSNTHIFGTAADDIWISGTFGLTHYDGAEWTSVDDPELGFGATGVWGSAPDDVWIATDDESVVHYDGSVYETVEPRRFIGSIAALWGTGPDDVWSVGTAGSIGHYDGTAWEELEHQAIGSPQLRQLFAVHGSSSSNVWAVGQVLNDAGAQGIVHRRP